MKKFKMPIIFGCIVILITVFNVTITMKLIQTAEQDRYCDNAYILGYVVGYQDGYLGIEARGTLHLAKIDYPSQSNLEWSLFNQNFPTGYLDGHQDGVEQAAFDHENK